MFWKTCALSLVASTAMAGGIDVRVENFTKEFGVYRVVVLVTNNTSRTQENVYVDCVVFGPDGKAIGIAKTNIAIMYPSSKRHETATLATSQSGQSVSCRVAS